MDKRASNVLVLDADNILLADTLERFVARFIQEQYSYKEKGVLVLALQGFPISKSNLESDDEWGINVKLGNWIARAIDFRLAKRNMIEFAAKDCLNLPVQITGSLFMIRADIIKSIKFSNDLCEDWDLTVDLYCSQPSSLLSLTIDMISSDNNTGRICNHPSNNISHEPVTISLRPRIIFDQELVSYCEVTTDLTAYFRQRMRVSEGHTRGLRRKIRHIAESKMLSPVDKAELLLNGLQYAKFIFVLGIGIINMILLLMFISDSYNNIQRLMNMFGISFLLQAANLTIALTPIIQATKICRPVRRYDIKDVLSLLVLYVITTPAFVIGSLRGFFLDKGTFYKTPRNLPKESKLGKPSVLSESAKNSPFSTGS
jgi:cellulose synthase/poly-beta-1,6-N-acetylglucosamine synthase-like glycosyltransferase